MAKKKKNKNSHQNKPAAPKKPQEEKKSAPASDERYVSKRKRDKNKTVNPPPVTTENDKSSKTPEPLQNTQKEQAAEPQNKTGEDLGAVFAVSPETNDTPLTHRRPSKFEKKHARKTAPAVSEKESKPKKSITKKEAPAPAKLSDIAVAYDRRVDAEYMEKLKRIQEWEDKFFHRLSIVFGAVLVTVLVFMGLWRFETGRISIEGKDEYEIGINVFGMTAAIYEKSPSAMLKEVPVNIGTVKVVVNRIIDDMYYRPDGQKPYADGEPILMGFYRADKYEKFFSSHDYSRGRADMQLRHASRQDKKNAKKYNMNIGRAVLIREYTEKYGGEADSNFESLRREDIIKIINRDAVTKEAAKAVADIFSGKVITDGSNIPMIITENSTPAPAAAETPVTTAPQTALHTPTKSASSNRRTTSSSGTAKKSYNKSTGTSSDKSNSDDDSDSKKSETKETAAPAATASAPKSTPKPLAPVREVSRPTANPTVE